MSKLNPSTVQSYVRTIPIILEDIPTEDIYNLLMQGAVLKAPSFLQSIGYFERIVGQSLDAISQAVGYEKAQQVKKLGFEHVHEIFDIEEIISISFATHRKIERMAFRLANAVTQQVFHRNQPFYYEKVPNVRFQIPYDTVMKGEKKLGFEWSGKMTPHCPHHDSWYHCPLNCFNVWIAIGPVEHGNGLTIYPQVYGNRLPCNSKGRIERNQYFGEGISFNLNPGDALIFHGEHLHSSEINRTNLTRYVVSLRMTVEKPLFLGNSPYANNYLYGETRNGLLPYTRTTVKNFVRRVSKQIDKVFDPEKMKKTVISATDGRVFNDTSDNFPEPIPHQVFQGDETTVLKFSASHVKSGQISPLSQDLCVTKLDDMRVLVFSRYCPHEGADLGAGSLEENKVLCPWHSLHFSLDNGASSCKSLKNLKVYPVFQDGETLQVEIPNKRSDKAIS